MPTTVWPSDAMNSFGAYVASAATVSDPCDLMEDGTWAAMELTSLDGTDDGVEPEPDPEPLLQAVATRPTDRNATMAADSFL
jgi:hypothetical protein